MLELSDPTEEQDHTLPNSQSDLAHLRILVVMPTIPLHGMERKTLSIMKMMRDRGADVLFVTQKDYGQDIQREVDRISCRWVPASFDKLLHLSRDPREMLRMLLAWLKSAAELSRIRKAYKPTHIHIPNITIFLYSWAVLLGAKETVVFSLPNPPETTFTGYKRLINNFIWRYGVERVCDRIVCNSKFTLSQLRAVGMRTRKAQIIYNSTPTRSCRAGDAPAVDPSKVNVAYVGRICSDKGVDVLVETAMRIVKERKDVDFHVVGDYKWQNPFAQNLIEKIKLKGLESRIRFLGEVNDVSGFLSQCDLHVCPSVWEEPFGLVVLEAKSESIPSVVFPSGGLKETVTHLVDGYVCREKTPEALYEGVTYFLERPEIMKESGQEANRTLSEFSAKKIGDSWAALFRESRRQ